MERPAKGAHVLARMLRDRGYDPVPAKSTINAILRRYGFIEPSQSAKAKRYKRFEHERPNDLWQMDFKGHFPMTGGHRCHPLTVLDDHSRFSLGVRACLDEKGATVQRHLADIFRRYGLPHAMLMENGSPWGVDAARSFTAFTIWLMELGVKVIHSRPRHPQTIGKLERFHKSLNVELLQGNSYTDISHAQRGFDRWRDFYNLERPHHSLKFDTPSKVLCKPQGLPRGPARNRVSRRRPDPRRGLQRPHLLPRKELPRRQGIQGQTSRPQARRSRRRMDRLLLRTANCHHRFQSLKCVT